MPSTAADQSRLPGQSDSGAETGGSWKSGLSLALLSAGLFALSMPGRPFPWVAWIALVPLFVALFRTSPGRGLFLGSLFGWLIWFTSVWWLHAPLHDIAGMSRAGSVLFIAAGCLLMGLPYGLAAAIIAKWRRRGVLGAARDAAIFTCTVTFLTPVFQGSMAHTQYQYPVMLQMLELGGTPLLLFLMLTVNRWLADAFVSRSLVRIAWKPVAGAAGIVAMIAVYGGIRLHQLEMETKTAPADRIMTVGAIQPNIPIPVAADRQPDASALTNDFFSAIEQARHLASKVPAVDLFAFPENPATFLFNSDNARRDALGKLIQETGKPALLNADAIDLSTPVQETPPRYNVALLLDAQRNLAGHYAKMKRVPAVEYIPGEQVFPWLRKWLPKSQRVVPGSEPVVFNLNENVRIIPLICYEGTISSFTRQFVERGGNVVVNLVNDSWFLRTPASEIHLALTLFRAVEYRVPVVRVTNSGVGAHIQPDGRIVTGSRTKLFSKAETAFPLYIPPHRSFYARVDNWWMLGLLILLAPPRSNVKR